MIYIFLLNSLVLFAQSRNTAEPAQFIRLSVNDGLSQSAISDIFQDRKGFVWLATRDGLNRYDGDLFTVYRRDPEDNTTISDNSITTIAEDDKGRLWFGAEFGLSRYSYLTDEFIQYIPRSRNPYSGSNYILSLQILPDGKILTGTQAGLLVFDPETATFDFEQFLELKDKVINTILRLDNGELLIGTNGGLHVYHENFKEKAFYNYHPEDSASIGASSILSSYLDQQGRIWLGTLSGLDQFHPESGTFSHIQLPYSGWPIYDITETPDGNLWLARDFLVSYNPDQNTSNIYKHDPNNPKSISGDLAFSLMATEEGILWVGTNGHGLNILNPLAYDFHNINHIPENSITLGNSYVSSIYKTEDELLVGTFNTLDVISLEDQQTIRSTTLPLPAGATAYTVYAILKGQEPGYFWISCGDYLFRYHLPTGTFTLMPISANFQRISTLAWYDNETLLIGGQHGLYRYNLKTGQSYRYPSVPGDPTTLTSHDVTTIAKFRDEFWIGTARGITILNPENQTMRQLKHQYDDPESLSDGFVKCFFVDSKQQLWVGTWGGGMCRYKAASGTFEHYGIKEGLPNNVVYGIMEDDKGFLWFSTNRGISRFAPTDESIITFRYQDGLQSDEFNTGAYFKDSQGIMYFGGINGLTYFHPSEIKINRRPPNTVITNFYLNNIEVDPGPGSPLKRHILETDTVRLSWNQNNIAVRVAALDYASARMHPFRYQLEGYDEGWESLGTRNYINYTSLSPGWYTLRVQGANQWGYWDEPGRSLVIYLKPPIWYARWFQILMGIMALGLVYSVYNLRTKYYRRQNVLLESEIKIRTRTIQEKNEEIATQNEEIEQQNEELRLTSENLSKQNAELLEQKDELRKLKDNLEILVEERTLELIQANRQMAEQNSQLEQFAFITAHNLKAPISQFLGLLSILPPLHNFDDYTREVLERMHGSAEQLQEVVNDLNLILDIKKGTEREFVKVDLMEHVIKVAHALKNEAQAKNITIELPKQKKVYVLGFPPYVHSIVHNLIHNAIKYSRSEVTSWIKVKISQSDEVVEMTVEDNGIGIDMKAARDKIFKLYQRFNTSHPGKGFGLFLVKTQIESMGGSVSLSSEPDQGTAVFVHFIPMPEVEE